MSKSRPDVERLRELLRLAKDVELEYWHQEELRISKLGLENARPVKDIEERVSLTGFPVDLEEFRFACRMETDVFGPQVLAWAERFQFTVEGLHAVLRENKQEAFLVGLEAGLDVPPLQDQLGFCNGALLFWGEAETLKAIERGRKSKIPLNDDFDRGSGLRSKNFYFCTKNGHVTELCLEGGRFYALEILPASIGNLNHLQVLHLNNNRLESVPETVGSLKNLVKLSIRYNLLSSLPSEIGDLAALVDLDLCDNELSRIPSTIGKLKCLKCLDLSQNPFTDLPDEIGRLESLEFLHIFGLHVMGTPRRPDDHRLIEDRYTGGLLTSLPKTIGDLGALKELWVVGNKLTSLPETIRGLISLQKLILADNQLVALPDEIGALSQLQVLQVDKNELTTLPESVGNLSSLRSLVLYNNHLRTLPESLGQLSALEELILDNNQITSLPKSITALNSLRNVSLRKNPFDLFPPSIEQWIHRLEQARCRFDW